MGAFDSARQFLGRPLDQAAIEHGYREDNVLILRGDEEALRRNYPATYANILSCRHHADQRTPLRYAQDLVASWLVEDRFFQLLSSERYQLAYRGADRERRILPRVETSTTCDFVVTSPRGRIDVELMNDYTGFWGRTGTLHLRDSKYFQLQRGGSLLIAADMVSMRFAIYDFRRRVPAKYIDSHRPYGYKPAYELSISGNMLRPIGNSFDKNMEQALYELVK